MSRHFNKMKRTRLKLTIYFGTGILGIGVYSAIMGLEGPATAAVIALGGIIAKYHHDETKRPSTCELEESTPIEEMN